MSTSYSPHFPIANLKFANALQSIPQSIPPIWFMRQAGRYHSHYRKLKEKYTFLELCKNPQLSAEVALGPILEFDFDVAILFSDLLFPLDALGMGLDYLPGPKLSHHLSQEKDVLSLRSLGDALPFLEFQKTALQLTRNILPKHVSLIGFIGGPWTLFTYAAIGKHEGNLSFAKTQTKLAEAFYEKILPLLKENLRIQMEGGAEIVMVFDTAAGDLDPISFQSLVIRPLQELCDLFPNRVGYYAKGTTHHQMQLLETVQGLAGFGIDHRFSLNKVFKEKRNTGFLQGNFDQSLLFLDRSQLNLALDQYLKPLKELSPVERRGWISGLGHGVLQHTPEDNVKFMIDKIRETFHD